MKFYENRIYHIYNQGNNKRQIFYSNHHYEYFLWKMKAYLLPFGELISWCLMPNHFHWQFLVKDLYVLRKDLRQHCDEVEMERRVAKFGNNAQRVKKESQRIANPNSYIDLNHAIGILQNSYSKSLNKEMGWTGSLFRRSCKAKDGFIDDFITLNKSNGFEDHRFILGSDYAFKCLQYIHRNPTNAGIVKTAIEYEWSSYWDYAGLRNDTICNIGLGNKIMQLI